MSRRFLLSVGYAKPVRQRVSWRVRNHTRGQRKEIMHTSWLSSSMFGTGMNCTGFRLKRTCLVKTGEQLEPDNNESSEGSKYHVERSPLGGFR